MSQSKAQKPESPVMQLGREGRPNSQEDTKMRYKRIVKPSTLEKSELNWSTNPWKPHFRKDERDDDTELFRRFKGILNKLTPQNFQKLMNQTMQLPINSEDRLKGVVDQVFEHATRDPLYCQAYANMARVMQNIEVRKDDGGVVQFRKLILIKCQKQFEKERNDDKVAQEKKRIATLPKNEQGKALREVEYLQMIYKKQIIGNICFIGELFKLQLLTEKIMQGCIFLLLKAKDEESLECMCTLVSIVGQSLDHTKGKALMDQYFKLVDKIIKEKKVSSRIRFMLQDIKELREYMWKPRRKEDKPVMLEEIRKEAKVENMKREQEQLATRLAPRKGKSSQKQNSASIPLGRERQPNSQEETKGVKRKVMHSTQEETVLGRSTNPWKPYFMRNGATEREKADDEGLFRRFKGILNKLTPQNFQKLMNQTMQLPINSEDRLKGVVDQVFEHAIIGAPRYCQSYANMARVMQNIEVRKVDGGVIQFRKLILIKCQKQFERERSDEKVKQEKQRIASLSEKEQEEALAELEYQQMIYKKQIVGNICFIGELFKLQLLTEKIMQGCIFLLLKAKDEESLECMSKLVSTVGQSLDHPKGKALMDRYFHQVCKIIEERKVSARIRFMLQDIKELRENNWKPRRKEAKPVLLDQIRKEAELENEKREKERVATRLAPRNRKRSQVKIAKNQEDGCHTTVNITRRKVKFAERSAQDVSQSCLKEWTDNLQRDLIHQFHNESDVDNNAVFDFIEKSIPLESRKSKEFIRALVSAVCYGAVKGEGTNSRGDHELLKRRSVLMQRFIDGDPHLELQALYAVQHLNYTLENPPGLLRLFFDVLYDEDVISEDAFYSWMESDEENEKMGKRTALKSVESFFTWLEESDPPN